MELETVRDRWVQGAADRNRCLGCLQLVEQVLREVGLSAG